MQNLLDLQIAKNGLCWVLCFCRIRIAETAINQALAVCGGERGRFAIVMYSACLYVCGSGNMPRSSRCIPRP